MKNLPYLLFIFFSVMSLSALAQNSSKKTLNYQAVILDPKAIDIPGASISGQPLNKGNVCLRFSLLNAQGGLDYEETQQVITDEFGLVSVAIGTGIQGSSQSVNKIFNNIIWDANIKSLQVSVSYDACGSFKQVSTQILNYTPYALYAEAVDYKNVREAPTKLSQFSNDAGYLIPKDLDPIKSDIKSNTSQIQTANQIITENKQTSDSAFLITNQNISSLDKLVATNTSSITTINTKINDQQNQISDNRNQLGGLQGQINVTNSIVNNLTGAAEVLSNKSTATDLGGVNTSDQLYPSQKAAKTYVDLVVSQIATSGVPDATTLAAGKIQLAGDLGGTATNPTVPGLVNKANLNSPTFIGTPTAPTPASSDNSTKLATTAFVATAVSGISGGGGSISVGSISNTSTSFGASINAGVLNLAPANGSNGGIVTTGAQSFAGAKTFAADLVVNGIITSGTVSYPNVHNATAGQVLTTNISGVASWATPASTPSPSYAIGLNNDLGGYVFYLVPGAKHGLVAETETQGQGNWYTAQDMISIPSNHSSIGQLFTDWRLPTINELGLLYDQRAVFGILTGLYWSSTDPQGFSTYGLLKNFSTGVTQYFTKDSNFPIRAIRSF